MNHPQTTLLVPFKCAAVLLFLVCAHAWAEPKSIPPYPARRSLDQCARILEKSNPYAQELKSHLVEYRTALQKGDLASVRAYLEAGYPTIFPEVMTAAGPISYSALEPVFRGHRETGRKMLNESPQADQDRAQILELVLAHMTEGERNWVDRNYENAFFWAIRERYWDAIPYLLKAGIYVGQRNKNGETFLDRALQGEFAGAIAALYVGTQGSPIVPKAPQTDILLSYGFDMEQLLQDPFRGGYRSVVSEASVLTDRTDRAIPISQFPSRLREDSGDSLITYVVRNWDRLSSGGKRPHDRRPNLHTLLQTFEQLQIPFPVNQPEGKLGRTALWIAVADLDATAVELLMSHGADPSIPCSRKSPEGGTTPEQELRRHAARLSREIKEGKRNDPRSGELTRETEEELKLLQRVSRALKIQDNLLTPPRELN